MCIRDRLYTVGLTSDVLPSDKIDLDKRESAEKCDTSVSNFNQKDNTLQSTLYGLSLIHI